MPLNTYSVGIHLDSAEGQFVGNQDAGIPASRSGCQFVSLPLKGLAPGQYSVYMVVYNWQSGERLAGQGSETQATDRVPIGEFEALSSAN